MCFMSFEVSDRRRFVKGGIALAGAASVLPLLNGCEKLRSHSGPTILSGRSERSGNHFVGAYSLSGEPLFDLRIPDRAHGMAMNPVRPSEMIFFARRPGVHLHRLNIEDPLDVKTIDSEEGRHFYGHGCFSADGSWLYNSENDYENGRGLITVRDAISLQVVEEYSSYGIGPHELRLMPDQKTLVVANGGILTHPSAPREPLNIETMQPSLVYIDLKSGRLLGNYQLPYSQLGIRHIDVNADGRVALATQIEADAQLPNGEQSMPLLATHHGEDQLQLFSVESYSWNRLKDYCGSVAFAKGSDLKNIGAVTSPRAGRLAIFDFLNQNLVADFAVPDVCGVCFSEKLRGFVASTGSGAIYLVEASAGKPNIEKLATQVGVYWDNHLLVV